MQTLLHNALRCIGQIITHMDQKNLIYWMIMKQPHHQWMQLYTKIFSHEEPIVIMSQSFESLLPGKEIDESVCDLCMTW